MQASLEKLRTFLEQLAGIPAYPVGITVEELQDRLAGVDNGGGLAAFALEVEASIKELGSGLPTGTICHCSCHTTDVR